MNSTNFKQYNTAWAKLGYPKAPHYIKDCGCGEVAIANCIIEMERYARETPKTIQPYCKQFAAPNGDGTYWSAPPTMMAHYGMTEVQEHQTMNPLWKELAKGGRVAVYLMSNRPAGNKNIKWTGSKHFICSTDYRYDEKTGRHWVYVKDSNSTSDSRNGWISYEDNLRNAVYKVWSGKLNGVLYGAKYYPSTPYTGKTPSGIVKKGSTGDAVKAVQTFLNWCLGLDLAVDGICGDYTDEAIRKFQNQYSGTYGIAPDGVFGNASIAAAKKIIAKYAIVTKELEACVTQAEWMKNYKYVWESNPTVAKSKTKGTCVTYVACVLQRIGVLPSGKYIWHDEKGKVYGQNSKMEVVYMSGTISANKSKLKAGDIIMAGDKYDSGAGSHIFIINGGWDGGNPIVWDNHSAERRKKGYYGNYVYNGSKKIIAVVRLK